MIHKHRALERARSPKIIFVGGSNLAFGLDSQAVSKAFSEPVVNMGVSVNLGLRYQLEEIKDEINEGDTIVISPEYDLLAQDPFFSTCMIEGPRVMPRSAIWVLRSYATSPNGIITGGSNLSQVLQDKWTSWRWLIKEQFQDDHPKPTAKKLINPGELEALNRSHFTPEGDLIGHLSMPSYAQNWLSPIKPIQSSTIEVLNDFAKFVQHRGARVVMLPPPLARSAYDFNERHIETMYSLCRRNLIFPVLSQPSRYVFDNKQFFNTMWHLLAEGRQKRTQLAIEDLSPLGWTDTQPQLQKTP